MIFSVPGHIEMIRNGQKTQTRRLNRGIYRIGRDYAVQRKRGALGEKNIRIKICKILEETGEISIYDATQEGDYTPLDYELEFKKAYPKWDGKRRWIFRFCVIEVQK